MGKFKNIHLFIKKISLIPNKQKNITEIKKIFNTIIKILSKQDCRLSFDISCKQFLTGKQQSSSIKNDCDLIIVIGGDGSLLNCIRKTVDTKIPILGIHKGRLGFLADLDINKIKVDLIKILSGEFIQENRSLLYAQIKRANNKNTEHNALAKHNYKTINYLAVNDIVLYNGKIPKLIEFQIFINNQFVLQQRADGLIVATPTGSTAYSLSAGGPILYPTLKNFTLVPLYPHTLSSRPIVVGEDSLIKLKILHQENNADCGLSFDGQKNIVLQSGDKIIINKYPTEVKLIHPADYNYFSTLREKLGWNN